jgi:hypothetical protein
LRSNFFVDGSSPFVIDSADSIGFTGWLLASR